MKFDSRGVASRRRARGLVASGLAAIVVWAFFARWEGLVGPFGLGWQWLGSSYAMQSRNLLRYGPIATHFAGVVNADHVPPAEWSYYMHHPPGTMWTMAASLRLLGDSAFATKLPAVLAALGQVVVTFFLVARALSLRAGLAAALMTATLPAGAYFSTHGSELGPLPVCFGLLALLLDERARDRDPVRPGSAAPLAAFVVASLYSWAAFPVAAWIALRDAWGRRFRRALVFGLAPFALLALHLAHIRLATGAWNGGGFGTLLDMVAAHGVGGFAEVVERSSVASAAGQVLDHLRTLFTSAGLVLLVAGSLLVAFRGRVASLGASRVAPLFLSLLVFALGYSVPFPEAVWFHSYWLLIALPLVACCAGVVMHAAAVRPWLAGAVATTLVAVAIASTLEVRAAQLRDRSSAFEEFGGALRSATPSGTRIFSTEMPSPCLLFYADRTIYEVRGDDQLAVLRSVVERRHGTGRLAFAWVDPPHDPSVPRGELEAWLRARGDASEIDLPRSARRLALFDLMRPR